MKYLDSIEDKRSKCLSILTKMELGEYFHLVESAYKNKGNLLGQRAPLKTKTAQKIRERMISDIGKEAVLPAVVLGVVVDHSSYAAFNEFPEESIEKFRSSVNPENHITIIDGMQRTTALYEAVDDEKLKLTHQIRVELWIATYPNSLLYRMLVLNSGQIPWKLKRQVEVIFRSLKVEIEKSIDNIRLYSSDDRARRSKPGEYQAADFIELFIIFGLKKGQVDMQDQISEEFARLDFIDTSSSDQFSEYFLGATDSLVKLDFALSRAKQIDTNIELKRFKRGFDLFTSSPARVGFMIAFSRYVFGISGLSNSVDVSKIRFEELINGIENQVSYLNAINEDQLGHLLDLGSLNERIKIPTGRVGDFEREYFTKAFNTFFTFISKGDNLISFSPLWMS